MYCRYCGKELPNDSNFCPNCGKKQKENNEFDNVSSRIRDFFNRHKIICSTYGIWVIIHLSLLLFSRPRGIRNGGNSRGGWYSQEYDLSGGFFPFTNDIDCYDISEFFFYTTIIPLVVYVLFRLYKSKRCQFYKHIKELSIKRIVNNIIQNHSVFAFSFLLWMFVQVTLFVSSYFNRDVFNSYYDDSYLFYPFNTSLSDVLDGYYYSISFFKVGSYDLTEFIFYTIAFLIVALPILWIANRPNISSKLNCIIEKVFYANTRGKSEHNISSIASYEKISTFGYLFKRLAGTLIDKFAIVSITLGVVLAISIIECAFNNGQPILVGYIGTFSAIFHMSTDWVYNVAVGLVMKNYSGDVISHHMSEINDYYSYLIGLDVMVVSAFTIVNAIYYCLFEMLFKASLGKKVMGMMLVNERKKEIHIISTKRILLRVAIFLVMMLSMLSIRWLLGVSYYVVIPIFFIMLDLPVLFVKRSLLDILSDTKLVYKVEYREDGQSITPKKEYVKSNIIKEQKLQLLYFYLDSLMTKEQNELFSQVPLKLPIKQIDIDNDSEGMSVKYNIRCWPVIILTDINGMELHRWQGMTKGEIINAYLKEYYNIT